VTGLRLGDVQLADRRLFIAEGKGCHQRIVPVAGRFFTALAAYLDGERPAGAAADAVFVVLKGPRAGCGLVGHPCRPRQRRRSPSLNLSYTTITGVGTGTQESTPSGGITDYLFTVSAGTSPVITGYRRAPTIPRPRRRSP